MSTDVRDRQGAPSARNRLGRGWLSWGVLGCAALSGCQGCAGLSEPRVGMKGAGALGVLVSEANESREDAARAGA